MSTGGDWYLHARVESLHGLRSVTTWSHLTEEILLTLSRTHQEPQLEIWTSLTQGILSGLVAGFIAGAFFHWLIRRSEKRSRRHEIVVLLSQCSELITVAAREGTIAKQWADPKGSAFSEVSNEYWRYAIEALGLFQVREQVVAKWASAELESGHIGLFDFLQRSQIPMRRKAAQAALDGPLPGDIDADGTPYDVPFAKEGFDFGPPRASMLVDWAELRSLGPVYGSLEVIGDESRHHIVIPNSDVGVPDHLAPVDGLVPQGIWWRGPWSEKRKARFLWRLEKKNSKEWSRRHGQSRLTHWVSKLSRASRQFFRRD